MAANRPIHEINRSSRHTHGSHYLVTSTCQPQDEPEPREAILLAPRCTGAHGKQSCFGVQSSRARPLAGRYPGPSHSGDQGQTACPTLQRLWKSLPASGFQAGAPAAAYCLIARA